MAKTGFSGQWIDICRVGKVKDASGVERDLSVEFLQQVVGSYKSDEHEAPLVVGHPEENAPAFGWVSEVRLNGDRLEAKFNDTDDAFEKLVREGKYRKRSASFYLNPPALRHVGFLGAQPPAVKGLREIQFNDGDKVSVEISFNEENVMEKKDEHASEETKTFKEWMKEIFGGGQQPAPAPANFSEADAQRLINAAVATAKEEAKTEAKAEFIEELEKRDTIIEGLRSSADANSASGKRVEIVAFCERQGNGKITPAMKRAGIIEFMESLETADAGEKEKAIVCFAEGADGAKTEIKFSRREWFENFVENLPPFVQFGEKFGEFNLKGANIEIVNPEDVTALRGAMGVKTEAGGEK